MGSCQDKIYEYIVFFEALVNIQVALILFHYDLSQLADIDCGVAAIYLLAR